MVVAVALYIRKDVKHAKNSRDELQLSIRGNEAGEGSKRLDKMRYLFENSHRTRNE